MAVSYVALPFVVVTMEGAFRTVDRRLELAAATLGATPAAVARTISLPMVLPSLSAGAVLAWARSMGEFGATVTFAGNLPGRTQTLPLATFLALETDLDQAVLLSLLLLAPTMAMLAVTRAAPECSSWTARCSTSPEPVAGSRRTRGGSASSSSSSSCSRT